MGHEFLSVLIAAGANTFKSPFGRCFVDVNILLATIEHAVDVGKTVQTSRKDRLQTIRYTIESSSRRTALKCQYQEELQLQAVQELQLQAVRELQLHAVPEERLS